ncbi:extracellular solute-binding protein [Nonomuraea salmonea]|uniref:extracellular solute-binding protein n=1 Tax=Nonomuraea salmonea TaxID=46181 RepID=UPI0031E73D65
MPEALRRVGEVILGDPAEAARSTIIALAERAGSSPATVTRFCRAFGFSGYAELRVALATETGRAAQAGWGAGVGHEIGPDDPLDAAIEVMAAADTRLIQDTAAQLDLDVVGRVAAAIVAAPRVLLVGVSTSGNVATMLEGRLRRIGIPVWSAGDAHVALSEAALMKAGDVAIGISHRGRTREVMEALAEAGGHGALTVAVTSFARSPPRRAGRPGADHREQGDHVQAGRARGRALAALRAGRGVRGGRAAHVRADERGVRTHDQGRRGPPGGERLNDAPRARPPAAASWPTLRRSPKPRPPDGAPPQRTMKGQEQPPCLTPPRISRRELLRGAALVPVAGALAACATPAAQPAQSSSAAPAATSAANPFGVANDKPLEVWIFDGGFGQEYATNIHQPLFKSKYPSVEIKHNSTKEITKILQPRFAGGNPPEVIDNSGANFMDFGALSQDGQLQDLTPLLDAPSWDDPNVKVRDTIDQSVIDIGMYDGKFSVLGYVNYIHGIWYSQKVFRENEWEVPKTWDAFLALCETIKKSGKMAPFTYAGKFPPNTCTSRCSPWPPRSAATRCW